MLLFRMSLITMVLIWLFSLVLWLMPEQMRWDMGLFFYYRLTFLELPFVAVVIGIVLVYARKLCTSPKLFKANMFAAWGYVFFPIILSGALLIVTAIGITGY